MDNELRIYLFVLALSFLIISGIFYTTVQTPTKVSVNESYSINEYANKSTNIDLIHYNSISPSAKKQLTLEEGNVTYVHDTSALTQGKNYVIKDSVVYELQMDSSPQLPIPEYSIVILIIAFCTFLFLTISKIGRSD